jgi:hypothetical protein
MTALIVRTPGAAFDPHPRRALDPYFCRHIRLTALFEHPFAIRFELPELGWRVIERVWVVTTSLGDLMCNLGGVTLWERHRAQRSDGRKVRG